jgi:hypothetical protein
MRPERDNGSRDDALDTHACVEACVDPRTQVWRWHGETPEDQDGVVAMFSKGLCRFGQLVKVELVARVSLASEAGVGDRCIAVTVEDEPHRACVWQSGVLTPPTWISFERRGEGEPADVAGRVRCPRQREARDDQDDPRWHGGDARTLEYGEGRRKR